ncbi:MAG: DNA mismatch repair protein MutT [Flammeovirgaceae bacterium]|nr:DNA mismatch repair protein MutT [Flammeovirgaceae bacterium]MBE61191.1 DNA mismatch repair protein MutT [Flammeovirgaceae bacterium]MBR07046.1 DNA mismatch repair protein MutT [Rickettsiales bacterium]HCX22237.1 DNA mismatch repair protein MutT [Cytophagales bacterium]|tara:strand:- start:524 stop:1066 length:543 start_codon:yes stop_codon:yes gene_type:complete
MEKNPWKTISSKQIYDNQWITLEEDQVTNPGGGKGIYGKVLFKSYAIGIVPLDKDQNTWLVGQWRYTLGEYSWEIPMGGGPKEEGKLDSAKRELKEETGLTAKKWTEFVKMHTSNSVTDEVGFAFLAEELTEGETEFEETEDLKIRKLPFKEAHQMVLDGQITDSLSMVSILKLGRMLGL